MENSQLISQIKSFEDWKTALSVTMDEYRAWLQDYKLGGDEEENSLEKCRKSLNDDRLSIAFVAEFSRGKTELINALFFSDYGRRLLPSTAGRTTMCPTEIFYDRVADEAYIQLLPIETRLEDISLDQYKHKPDAWVTLPLDPLAPDQVEATLQNVVHTRHVPPEEAEKLGLYDSDRIMLESESPETVEIPKWRHARISFPHPLLKRGLTILDTPGLNALGTEPELTLSMLPSAQVVLFVLAADTGVTRSDMEIWTQHLQGCGSRSRQRLMVVLNKIDTLWDEMRNDNAILDTISQQRDKTARILGIDNQSVFPVSAQKGLLAKSKDDQALLDRSALSRLEDYLSQDLIKLRREIIQETITYDVVMMLDNSVGLMESRRNGIKSQLTQLGGLSGKSQEAIEQLMQETKEHRTHYQKNLDDFRTSRRMLEVKADKLRRLLDMQQLEKEFEKTRLEMTGNWTTLGLQKSMRTLFELMRIDMRQVVKEVEQTRRLVRGIYHRFQSEHGVDLNPRMFSVMKHRVELELLYQEAEIFRNSPLTAATEKHFVINKFFVALVDRARMIFNMVRYQVDNWLDMALEPLVMHLRERRDQIETRFDDLQRISQSRDTLNTRIAELKQQNETVLGHLLFLRALFKRVSKTLPPQENELPAQRQTAGAG
jgi:hypothetical protein